MSTLKLRKRIAYDLVADARSKDTAVNSRRT